MYACHLPKKGSDQHFYHQNLIKVILLNIIYNYFIQWDVKNEKKIGAWHIEVRNVEKNLTPDANFVLKRLSIFKRYCWLFQDPYWKKDVAWMTKKHSNFKDENILEILKEWSEFWRFLKSILRGREWVGRGWRSWVVEGGGQGLKFAEKDRWFSRFKPVTLRKVLSRNYAITSIGWT